MIDSDLLDYYIRLKHELELSDYTLNYAILIHEKILQTNLIRDKKPFLIASTCVYIACRHSENFRTLRDVSNAGGIEQKDIARCYRLLLRNHNELGFVKPSNTRSNKSVK